MSLRFVLLGLLSENSGHGYGLRKGFIHRLGHFRKINEGQLYTELAKMEKDGLVKREIDVPDKGPVRKILHITPRGRKVFREWLLSEAYENEGILYDFIQGYPFFGKCTFFNHMKPEEALAKIETQLSRMDKKKKAYKEILTKMRQRTVDSFRVRILEYGMEEMDHRMKWLGTLKKDIALDRTSKKDKA